MEFNKLLFCVYLILSYNNHAYYVKGFSASFSNFPKFYNIINILFYILVTTLIIIILFHKPIA